MEAKFFATIGDRLIEDGRSCDRVPLYVGLSVDFVKDLQRLVNWLSVFGKNAWRRITSLLAPRLDSRRDRKMVESALTC